VSLVKSLAHADRFKIEVTAERNGCLRLLGNFADATGLNLRPDEVAVVRWNEGRAELLVERRPDAVADAVGVGAAECDALLTAVGNTSAAA